MKNSKSKSTIKSDCIHRNMQKDKDFFSVTKAFILGIATYTFAKMHINFVVVQWCSAAVVLTKMQKKFTMQQVMQMGNL